MSSDVKRQRTGREDGGVRLPSWLAGAIIVLLTLIAYYPAMSSGGYIWDDDSYVTENALLWEDGGLRRIWWPDDPFQDRSPNAGSLPFLKKWFKPQTPQYYPAVFTTFWLEHKLWGFTPSGFHAVNVLLHAANAVLLWLILVRLRVPGAWMIGAVFALHPIHVETVAWVTERKNTLSLLFYLIAAMSYLTFDRVRFGWTISGETRRSATPTQLVTSLPRSGGWGWYVLALCMFVLALLSKSVTCSLPAALILVLFWLRAPLTPRRLAPLIPFFVIGVILAMNTALIEYELVGARGSDFEFTVAQRTIIASRALLFYVAKHLWPHPLIFVYPRWDIDAVDLLQWLPLVFWILVGAACLIAVLRGVRGPFVALSLFAGTAFPALGYFNVYPHIFSFVADHFIYHASIGLIAFVIGAAAHVIRRVNRSAGNDRSMRPATIVAAALLLIALGAKTFSQSQQYESAERVYRRTIALNPEAWMPHNNLAAMLIKEAGERARAGDDRTMRALALEAIAHADQAIAARQKNHRAHSNRAEALRLLGRYEEALAGIEDAIALVERDGEPESYHIEYTWGRGRILHHLGRYESAIEAHQSAVNREPENPMYRHDLAVALLEGEHWAEAAEQFEAIHAMRPEHLGTIVRLGAIHQRSGNYARAEHFLRLAIEHAQTMAEEFAAGARLIRLLATAPDPDVRNVDEALYYATGMAEATEYRDPGILSILADVHAAAGNVEEARQIAQRALSLARESGLRDVEETLLQQLQRLPP